MKSNDIKALHKMKTAELAKKLEELSLELATARMKKISGQLTNVKMISQLRDDIARVKTILRDRQIKGDKE